VQAGSLRVLGLKAEYGCLLEPLQYDVQCEELCLKFRTPSVERYGDVMTFAHRAKEIRTALDRDLIFKREGKTKIANENLNVVQLICNDWS